MIKRTVVVDGPAGSIDDIPTIHAPVNAGDVCSVCLNPMKTSLKQLHCHHVYHSQCIDNWLQNGHLTCPQCNTQVIIPTAIPVTSTCRECQRPYHRNPNLNPSSAAYFRCQDCKATPRFCTVL